MEDSFLGGLTNDVIFEKLLMIKRSLGVFFKRKR